MTDTTTWRDDERRLTAALRAKADQLDLDPLPAFDPLTAAVVVPIEDHRRPHPRVGHGSRRVWLAVGVLVVVAVSAGVLVASRPPSGRRSTGPADANVADGMAVLARLEAIPSSVAASVVPAHPLTAPPTTLDASPPQTRDGKPYVLYIGAEYCPYCAAQRWPLVLALARFGTFSRLDLTHSSSSDVNPDTASFTFHDASYTSPYLALDAVETESNQPLDGGSMHGYAPLDPVTPAQQQILQEHDTTASIPYVLMGGRYQTIGATYDVTLLAGKSAAGIAAALADPTTAISRAVWPQVDLLTADLCQLTGHQPASACRGS
jgi:hypothetical protein